MLQYRFARHAVTQWGRLAACLGVDNSIEELEKIFRQAKPEKPDCRSTRWNIFVRQILHGETEYRVAKGWRFVVDGSTVVTVERVRPHENYIR